MTNRHIIRFRSNETADYQYTVKGSDGGELIANYSIVGSSATPKLTSTIGKKSMLPHRFNWNDAGTGMIYGYTDVYAARFHMRNIRCTLNSNPYYRTDHVIRYSNLEYGTRARSNTLNYMLKAMSSPKNRTRFKVSFSFRSEKVWRVSFTFWNRQYETELNTINAERAINAAMMKWPTLFDGHVSRISVRRER